jgi:prepilin-type N-terminal cleavage/methylation domain-containing protein
MKGEKGFSLVEVVIAIGVLAIVAATIVTYFAWSFGVFGYADQKATAESLARSQMEYIKSQSFQPYNVAGPDKPYSLISSTQTPPYTVTYQTENITDNVTSGLQRITVTVFFKTDNITSLEGYKLNR